MRVHIDDEGRVRLPGPLMDKLKIGPGRDLEATVEKGRLVLRPLTRTDDPFAAPLEKPAENAFDDALKREAEDKARLLDRFDQAIKDKPTIDMDAELEERRRRGL